MDEPKLAKPDHVPLLLEKDGERSYLLLDESGSVKYFLWQEAGWQIINNNFLGHKIDGFDADLDVEGNLHLFGYDSNNRIYYFSTTGNKVAIEKFGQYKQKQIKQLSCCLTPGNLHLLLLARSNKKDKWWLFYHRCEQGTWQDGFLLDFGYFPLEQYGFMLKNHDHDISFLHRLYEEGSFRLVLRRFEKTGHLGKTIYLHDTQTNAFLPSFFVSPDNTIHFAWVSSQRGRNFLNYVREPPLGKCEYFVNMELPPNSLPVVPICQGAHQLILPWKNQNIVRYLISGDGGKNWQWGKNEMVNEGITWTRYRRHKPENRGYCDGNCLLVSGKPPEKILTPHLYLDNENVITKTVEELHALDLLSTYVLTRAKNLETANNQLEKRLKEKEKKLHTFYTWGISKNKTLQEQLTGKKIELEKLETFYKETLKELENKICEDRAVHENQNKQLLKQINMLLKETEKFKKEKMQQVSLIKKLEEQITVLKSQNTALKTENKELKTPKKGFRLKIFNKVWYPGAGTTSKGQKTGNKMKDER